MDKKNNALPRKDLTDEDKQKIVTMRERVSTHAMHPWQLRDFYLARWLVARNWDLDAACEMYTNSMKWRKENDIDNIAENLKKLPDFEHYLAYWPGRVTGQTKDGWEVVFESMGKIDPKSILDNTSEELRTKFNIWRMEEFEKRRRDREDQLGWSTGTTLVSDMSGLGWAHAGSSAMEVFRTISAINKLNYPETLRRSYIINAPAIFNMLWKLVSVFIDPSTLEKTSIHGSDYLPSLLESMELSEIPSNFGGTGPAIPEGGVYQPFDAIKVDITRGDKHEKSIVVENAGTLVEWQFTVASYDIGFSVVFKNTTDEEVVPYKKYEAKEPAEGSFKAANSGTYVFKWDNTFSWTRGKTIKYRIKSSNA